MNPAPSYDAGYGKWRVPDPKCVFLLVHGLGAHSGRWDFLAEFFLKEKVSSYAIDLPNLNSVSTFYDQILRIRKIAVKENPQKKIFLVGESLGGLVSFLLAAGQPELFDGVVCISPAFATKKPIGLLEGLKMLSPLLYDPGRKVDLPFDSSMCTRDVEYRRKMESDPLEYRSISASLVFGILVAQARARSLSKKMSSSVLFLLAGEDMVVDTDASKKIFDALPSKDKALVEFHDMYHSLSIDRGKEAVFEEILKWIGSRI